jgi:hypothetical protein
MYCELEWNSTLEDKFRNCGEINEKEQIGFAFKSLKDDSQLLARGITGMRVEIAF